MNEAGNAPVDKRSASLRMLDNILVFMCAMMLAAMTIIIALEVILRNTIGMSLQSTDEIGGYLLVAIAFLSAPVAQLRNNFQNVDLVYAHFSDVTKQRLQMMFLIIALIIVCILLWHLTRLQISSWRSGDQAPSILMTPLWLPRLVMPVGMGLLGIAIAAKLVRDGVRIFRPEQRAGRYGA